jgi:hypothetical protein
MLLPRSTPYVVLSIALIALSGEGSALAQAPNLPGFLEVKSGAAPGATGRPYLISINRQLPDANEARNRMAKRLSKNGQLDKVAFNWFGKEAPKRLNLAIGKTVPVEVAQAAVAAYARDSKLPVYLYRMSTDGGFGETKSVYVGAVKDRGMTPTTAEQIKSLLKAGLTGDEFMKLLPELPK